MFIRKDVVQNVFVCVQWPNDLNWNCRTVATKLKLRLKTMGVGVATVIKKKLKNWYSAPWGMMIIWKPY